MRYGLAQHERVTFYLLLATRPLHPEASSIRLLPNEVTVRGWGEEAERKRNAIGHLSARHVTPRSSAWPSGRCRRGRAHCGRRRLGSWTGRVGPMSVRRPPSTAAARRSRAP